MKGYNRLTERRETPLVMSMWSGDSHSLKIYNRLAELEDKIERGELVEVPKGAVVLTPEDREEEMRLCNEERKQAVREFAEKLRDKEFSAKIGSEWVAVVKSLDIDEIVKEVCGE